FQMESNNHFNYGTHSSANSGLKLSSGDSLYTNGSSMSFPQQGKNMNGEMNVNGATTVHGSGVPGSHPTTATYPHMSNHHQSSMGYDYLWGGHPQYGPAMGTSAGHGMHQKQPTPGMVQPQSQHHFQGHGQYQLNGGIESSHQPPLSVSPSPALVSLTKASASPAVTGSSVSAPGPPNVSPIDVESTPTHIPAPPSVSSASSAATPPGLSSPPLLVQGLRPSSSVTAEITPAGSKHLTAESPPSSLLVSPLKLSTPLATANIESRPAAVSLVPPVSSSLDSVAHQSALPPKASGAHTTISPPITVSTPSSSMSAPISSLQQMVQGSKVSCFPEHSGAQHEMPGPSKLMAALSSVGTNSSSAGLVPSPLPVLAPLTSTPPGSSLSALSSPMSVPVPLSVGNKPCEPVTTSQYQTQTPPVIDTGHSSFPSAASSPPPGRVNVPSPAENPTVQPRSTLPLLTTQASRTAPVSAPPALVSLPPAMDISSGVVQSSDSEQHSVNTTHPCALKQSSPIPENHGHSEDRHTFSNNRNGKPEEHLPKLDSGTARTLQKVEVMKSVHHRWKREIRVKKTENRMKGETWYYTPCGRRMKQFPEIVKYLKRHTDSVVTREHFSFSPRMPVGDFYEERETPEGMKWVLLANEEVPSMIMAITGRRGRPPNPDKEKPRRVRGPKGGQTRRPGRPPKPKMIDLLSKVDAKLLKRLEAKEALTEEEKEKLAKIKKKMKRKARMKRREDAKLKKLREEKKKAKALAKAQAEAEAAAQAALSAKRAAERRAQAQRRLEERKRQQLIAEELKKPIEDMCLTDHKPLPELSRIPGVVLSGTAFAHCLAVVEFLHSYGKVIGLNIPKDIPNLATLQEGLLGLGDSQGEVQDLLIKLVEAALHDPGLPSYYQSVKILGEKLVELELSRSTVSEVLRIFLESHGYETEVCNILRTKTFHALSPDIKAAILGFLVEELNSSNIVTSDIDNTLENMTTYRKNKWIIEGKLRKLKAALARRTGRSEEELCFEERRRSARVAEEENFSLEDSVVLERGSRRARKEDPTNASIPELERQIDKLTKRQAFFRKKLLQSSHSMRSVLLGQDRYRRRYLALPHLGGVLVEGPEELLSESDVLVAEVPVTFLKKEPKVEEVAVTSTPPATLPSSPSSAAPAQSQVLSPEEDPLPGTASLMSRPRGRGRPRKIKPEVELHLRTAKIRRRRRSSVRSAGDDRPGSPNSGTQDLTQAAFQNWLSQSQEMNRLLTNSLSPQPDPLLPGLPTADPVTSATPQDGPPLSASVVPGDAPPPPQLLPAPILPVPATPTTPVRPARRRRRGSRGSSPARRGPRGAATKRRGRPPNSVFQELEQQYFTQMVVKPIPASMVRGWWWIKEPEELYNTLQALHPRGIREKVLHKHLAKHMESLAEMCTKTINDPIFELKVEEKDVLMEALQQPWQVQEKAMETDISALQWVEDLEQRVIAADLHLKPYTIPDPDSTRDDLQYYEHDTDPRDDWIVRTKKEWSGLPRIATHPLDLAVLRLANLERNIERRYLKEPLWNPAEVMRLAPLTPTPGEDLESEITSRLRTWRQALDRCRSAPQLCLCLLQLEKAIAWERSVTKVTCQVCRKGDNDECLLLCDSCDRGCHMYCLRPKITQVPEGDWFCPTCVAKDEGELPRLSKTRIRVKKRRYEDDSSEDETTTRRSSGMATRNKDVVAPSSSSRHSGEGGSTKRRRMTTRNQPDLTFCEIILMEMEAHADAWPFLEPVNPRLVPGYRRIIKNPMDFLTMRERLLQGGYCSCEEFAADAQLVFNNCELFNEDTSEVGMAGHSMRRFFESRWAEFYSNNDK
uniref:Bromodomain adjacent to zinc finger domain, 2A n=1 Tax=Echeneis naucrates TaxID=173247 RepID=A0A665THP2_ECHNA